MHVKPEKLRELLQSVQSGETQIEVALAELQDSTVDPLAIAEVDTDRLRRTGHPEVIFGEGKEAPDIVSILERLQHAGQVGLVTRLDENKAEHICAHFPSDQTCRIS